jgi:hypothetical protein
MIRLLVLINFKQKFGLNDIIDGKLNLYFDISNPQKDLGEDLKFVDALTFSSIL